MYFRNIIHIAKILYNGEVQKILDKQKMFVEVSVQQDIATRVQWKEPFVHIVFNDQPTFYQEGILDRQISYKDILEISGILVKDAEEICRTWSQEENFNGFRVKTYITITVAIPEDDIYTLKSIGNIEECYHKESYYTLHCNTR